MGPSFPIEASFFPVENSIGFSPSVRVRLSISRESIHSFVRVRNEMERAKASSNPPLLNRPTKVEDESDVGDQPLRIADFGDYERATRRRDEAREPLFQTNSQTALHPDLAAEVSTFGRERRGQKNAPLITGDKKTRGYSHMTSI